MLSVCADNDQLYYAHKDAEQVAIGINKDGKQTSSWYSSNYLLGNLSKYQVMVVSKGTPQLAGEIADSCNVISKDELKSQGVTIDRNLHFTEHISAPCKKVSVGVGVLMRMWKLIPVEAQSRIFQAATSPYCGLAWHFCRSFNSRKLERVIERGLRAVYCDFSSPYGELLAKAHLTSLYKR